ncbi:16S rRNA processing protein RimM [Apibacter muscae]|uniref:Ribosome maturation factor RimM n=1 Tax=Apibacter muscae TaxID=2509004 RepID=A0A563DAU5_9FLAO|nr:ribosome maturation factor RimM [Apibacter muscae]TWP27336.1 16S rRNA processing protein RimM [Apibacter muscae]TWP28556.1 16S rRNA processing protein RimM [Apibacter muscae]
MLLKDCYYVGTITKTHGLKGHLVAKLDTDEPEVYENLESVFININGMPIPFFLVECQLLNKNSLRIKFENTSLNSQELIGKDIYLPLEFLPQLSGKQFYYHEVINFNILDQNNISVGKIIEINDQSPQSLFSIELLNSKNIYIPIINDWIIEVNRKEQYIKMNLPEGILDI